MEAASPRSHQELGVADTLLKWSEDGFGRAVAKSFKYIL